MYTQEQLASADIMRLILASDKSSETAKYVRKVAHKYLRDKSREADRAARMASLRIRPRAIYDSDDNDYWYEYGFMPPWILTDSQAAEWCADQTRYSTVPWDCSGQVITCWIDWHVNQDGSYSYVHRMTRDY